jgi:hypothetical protein
MEGRMSPTITRTEVIELQVVTTSGNYPSEGFRAFNGHELLHAVLSQAAGHLKLRNTEGWVAKLGDHVLNPQLSLEANGIPRGSQIFCGPVERGGGSVSCCPD